MKETEVYCVYLSDENIIKSQHGISNVAHNCVMELASVDLKSPKDQLSFSYNEYGKPYITNHEN